MNKIVVEDIQIKDTVIDDALTVEYKDNQNALDVNSLIICVHAKTAMEINYISNKDNKLNIVFNLDAGVELELFEYYGGIKSKVKIIYNLADNSILRLFKFNDSLGMRELNIINLNGKNSNIEYNLKTISQKPEKYDLMFYHRAPNTKSDIYCHGVSMNDGNLNFNITNVVYRGMVNASIEQNSRIILLDDTKCQINPNLLIDEYDVSANHSAIIGKFSEAELFYLNSRGIDDLHALNLLIKGFLLKGFNNKIFSNDVILKDIDKYWR